MRITIGAWCFLVAGVISSHSEASRDHITFNKDVASIFYKNCVECHRPGEIAPMSLITYKDARAWARSIKEKVLTREMPPWHADPQVGQFINDRRLSQRDIDTIAAWVDGGAKEGDPNVLPSPKFVDGWNIGKPDAVFYMPGPYVVPASGILDYKYFSVPTNFKRDVYIEAAEIRPGARSVVHHIIVWVKSGLGIKPLAGLAPGEPPLFVPKGFSRRLGIKIPAGSELVFQVHYAPNGSATRDRSYIGLIFAKERSEGEYLLLPIANISFVIPQREPSFAVESSYTFARDAVIFGLMPHMHARGKAFEVQAYYPDGTANRLLSVPKYDFRWQHQYVFKEAVRVPKGTRLQCIAHYDNSEKNKFNPDPNKEVRWGDQMWEEMMVGWVSYAYDDPAKQNRARR